MATIALENVKFKNGYSSYLRNALYVTIVIHFLGFLFSPQFEFTPYVLEEKEFIAIETADDFVLPPPPKEVSQPVIPMAAEEGEEAQDAADVAPTSFDQIDNLPPPPPPKADKMSKFFAFDEPPVLIKMVSPRYPELARLAGIEGAVTLRVLVSEKGAVISVSVLHSDVTPAMDNAAIAAIRKFRFKPARQRMKPVKAFMAIPIVFRLH
ncbi:energy transducer TonB [bacterium]|nr:energy transducer TonB [bacterium]